MCRAWPLYFTQVWRKASHCLCDVGLCFDVDDYGDYVCKPCHAEFFKIANEQCTACPRDFWRTSSDAATECQSCSDNTLTLQSGSDAQSKCFSIAGYFQTAAGQVGQACPAGMYQDDVDKTSCRECADLNAFSSSIAADTSFNCTSCPGNSRIVASRATVLENSGFTGEDGGPCVDCSAGKYKNTIGSEDCSLCPNITYSTVTAATHISTCASCTPHAESNKGSDSATDCLCVAGYEKSGENCVQFSAGDSTEDGCVKCHIGFYNAEKNSSCIPCAKGSYSDRQATELSRLVSNPYSTTPRNGNRHF